MSSGGLGSMTETTETDTGGKFFVSGRCLQRCGDAASSGQNARVDVPDAQGVAGVRGHQASPHRQGAHAAPNPVECRRYLHCAGFAQGV